MKGHLNRALNNTHIRTEMMEQFNDQLDVLLCIQKYDKINKCLSGFSLNEEEECCVDSVEESEELSELEVLSEVALREMQRGIIEVLYQSEGFLGFLRRNMCRGLEGTQRKRRMSMCGEVNLRLYGGNAR
eukprot:TRINITY_DN1115_c0_g1_i1.p1 TRINITY_DN1115_c0_g1~~TRINITY_DN1115_c0_g1_i1.p1  ORF type:complete len:130 (-),score=21.35 TRINITY_DN1115_c0_g1_i1:176-565(-)